MSVYKRPVKRTQKRFFKSPAQVRDYLGDLDKNTEIFGITRGDISIIDIIQYILHVTGPADVLLATWTAADADIKHAKELFSNGNIRNIQFIVDRSFETRQPAYCKELVKSFGEDSIRYQRLHCKFTVIRNENWNFVIRTSMNLNKNTRFENFEITEDKDFSDYFYRFFDVVFKSTKKGVTKSDPWSITGFDDVDMDTFDIFK